jgi:Fur family ferric uptake transcriptional regulator
LNFENTGFRALHFLQFRKGIQAAFPIFAGKETLQMQEVRKILSTHKLRLTANRADILNLFLINPAALSQPELERALDDRCDRVTIYRTLSTFLDKGILHKVLDDAGAMKYALCARDCGAATYHSHDHVHFKCKSCGNTECLAEVHIHLPPLPKGYLLHETNVLLQGICPACRN